ncbi:MAG TPA: XcyI family restriction endonuclease [Verrucomicrobiota bacterium]|nr:XcyI family restriction endonuclease [Verrucomicrobiota bacterium]
MLAGIGFAKVTARLLDDLTLLTVGPQLRGGLNNTIGQRAVKQAFELIRHHVVHAIVAESARRLELVNASGRHVFIQLASDPDITITERISADTERNLVAIEVKGGQDASNAWNRLGEAEKSHQSAKLRDFREFWTIVNVDRLDREKAREKSPTTNRFFQLRTICAAGSAAHADFRSQLVSVVGITA